MTEKEKMQNAVDGYFGYGTYNAIATDEERINVYNRLMRLLGSQTVNGNGTTAEVQNTGTGKPKTSGGSKKSTTTAQKVDKSSAYNALAAAAKDDNERNIEEINKLYTNEIARIKALLNAKNADAQSGYETGANSLNAATDKALAESYIAKQNSLRNIGQALSANGISGGGAESTLMGIENKYANSRGDIEENRQNSLTQLLQTMQKSKAQNAQSYSESALKAESERTDRLYNLQKAYNDKLLKIKNEMIANGII